jgi:hypothetical protein
MEPNRAASLLRRTFRPAAAIVLACGVALGCGTGGAAAAVTSTGPAPDAAWTPLAAGDYFHVYSHSYTPQIPPILHDDATSIAKFYFYPMVTGVETFTDGTGHGVSADIAGGSGNPAKYPTLSQRDKQGRILGWGGTLGRQSDLVSIDASLKYADSVRTDAWPTTAERPYNSIWFRQPKGYVLGATFHGQSAPAVKGFTLPERVQLQRWGITAAQATSLQAKFALHPDASVLGLLDTDPYGTTSGHNQVFVRVGTYGTTKLTNQQERRVTRALDLLGKAPLDPGTRHALVDWLTAQPNTTVTTSFTDEAGRAGTRLVFQHVSDKSVPAKDVTLASLKAQVAGEHIPNLASLVAPASFHIKAHREFRRWFSEAVIDPATDELLQSALYSRWETTAPTPSIERYVPKGQKPKVRLSTNRQATFDSAVYVARGRTATIAPVAEVCAVEPKVCQ